MVIEVPFDVEDTVCYTHPKRIFNSGTVEAIEAEVFIKVRNHETGELEVYKPEQIYTVDAARDYVESVRARLDALNAPKE